MTQEIKKYIGVGVTCIIGTFAFVTYFISDKNDALQIQIRDKSQKIKELQEVLSEKKAKVAEESSSSPLKTYSPVLLENSVAKKLAEQISDLEKQKDSLLKNLEDMSILSIDPKSELGELSKQLIETTDKEFKKKIINSLFSLKDPITFQVLWSYFFNNRETVLYGGGPSILEWIWLFDSMKPEFGTDFCIELMKGNDEFSSSTAFQELDKRIMEGRKLSSKQLLDIKQIALTSKDVILRTKMKILLSTHEKYKNEKPRDSRSLFQVLSDIENKLNKKNM